MKRDKIVSLRLSEAEYTRLAERAEHMGCNVSDLVRRTLLDELAPPAVHWDRRGDSVTVSAKANVIWNTPGFAV